MGQTKKQLAETSLDPWPIFPKRMVLECDESVHLHYRNLRLELSDEDFQEMALMFKQGLKFYEDRNVCAGMFDGQHIELGRGTVEKPLRTTQLKIDLQENLYKGGYDNAEYYIENDFVVIRYRDLRMEMSRNEFKKFAETISKASKNL